MQLPESDVLTDCYSQEAVEEKLADLKIAPEETPAAEEK